MEVGVGEIPVIWCGLHCNSGERECRCVVAPSDLLDVSVVDQGGGGWVVLWVVALRVAWRLAPCSVLGVAWR